MDENSDSEVHNTHDLTNDDDEINIRKSSRSRKPSQRVRDNLEQEATDKFWNTYKECKQICDNADKDIQGYCSMDVLSLLINRLNRSIEDIDLSYTELRKAMQGTVPPEVRLVLDRTKEDLNRLLQRARNRTPQWNPVHSHQSEDQGSRHSSNSRLSNISATSSKRIILAAQTAALQAEIVAKKREATRKAELCRFETEEITRQARLDAEERIRQAKFKEDQEKRQQELDDERLANELWKTQTELNALNNIMTTEDQGPILIGNTPAEQTPINTRTSDPQTLLDMNDIAKIFADSMNRSRLPAPEPTVFNGDPLTYPSWKAAFSALIESRGIPPLERLHYLRKYLEGEPKEAVAGSFYFESEDAYEKAKDILEDRYGNSFLVAEAFRDKLQDWPRLTGKDPAGLRKLSDFLLQCKMAMRNLQGLEILNDCRENRKILMKLPDWLVQRWSRIVADHGNPYPSFDRFAAFIKKEADIACNPITSVTAFRSPHMKDDIPKASFAKKRFVGANTHFNETSTHSKDDTVSTASAQACLFCKRTNHTLHNCFGFISKDPGERKNFVQKMGLCFGCLSHGHLSKTCTSKSQCKKCNKRHPTCLHGDYEILKGTPTAEASADRVKTLPRGAENASVKPKSGTKNVDAVVLTASNTHLQDNDSQMSSMIVPVYLSSTKDPENEHLVYALLDTQSDTTFILKETADKLTTPSEPTRLRLSTMTSTSLIDCCKFKNLQVRGINSQVRIPLPTTYSREFIPAHRSHIPTCDVARKWRHLKRIENEISPMQDCEVGLLIGYNCPQALAPREFISGSGSQPFAQKTDLGWSIVGRIQCTDTDDSDYIGMTHAIISKKIPDEVILHSNDKTTNEIRYVLKTTIKEEMSPPQIGQLLEADFPERKYEDATMSQDDLRFVKVLQHSIHQDEDGYYEMPLPFRYTKPELPNNEYMARKRLEHLKRRLQTDTQYYTDYRNFMEDILKHGDAEEIPHDEINAKNVWYIPHHGVYNPKKPEKIRIVFDCSARYKGTALNDHLLQGPDLLNSLVGVLCRFREGPIAVMGDIERMFHQFRVNKEDRDYLRFLWWKNGNLDSDPTPFRMKVHLFGATSSPGCANYGLKKIASDNRENFDLQVSEFITKDFYVDDGLRSFETVKEAIQLINGARVMCSKGNLRLHKLISNSREVMESIPKSEQAKEVKNLDLNFEELPIERALGIQWCVESDNFQFRLMINEKPMTRRGILSTVASIFDPLGCLAPFVLLGKQILQQMCKENTGWDEPLSEELRPRWERWLIELPEISNIRIKRCHKPDDFGPVSRRELHHFSDASFTGYGQCSYVRLINEEKRVHCSLLIGKARVTPLKVITMPRLELTAALVSVKIRNILQAEMKCNDADEYFWTDSKVVLGYINNDARRFHIFVANRIQQIKSSTEACQWRYVSTDQNPADHASRGLHAEDLAHSTWFTGPAFLWKSELPTEESFDVSMSTDDPEVKKVIVHKVGTKEEDSVLLKLEHFSDWQRAIKAVTALKTFISRKRNGTVKTPITVEDRHNGEMTIVKMLQTKAFTPEIDSLSNQMAVSTSLHKLDPFLDENAILRVGGRLGRSTLLYGVKHPIILPRHGHITNLIIKYFHERVQHQGRGLTINEIRSSGYWIIGCTKAVSSFIHKCVICRRLRGKLQTQKMADLPEDRVEPSPPFTYTGIDCFGPFMVKEGRKEHKRYGLLFTCMASRAIHIETLDDMTSDAFINGLRCFIALRGPVRSIRCDQGSNFVGADHELRVAMKEIKDQNIRKFLADNHCDFVMNSPSSSHMGGVWERQIRTIRSILRTMLNQHSSRLDSSTLRTFLYETMAIVNCRPLSVQNLNDPAGPIPLTPNHLLTMKSKVVVPPPGDFVEADVYARKRWRKVQYLANEFWTRWKKEFLLLQQLRHKWNKPQRNISVGDIVIIKDEDLVRGHFKLAKVVETISDKDNLVRRVRLLIGDPSLSKEGKRLANPTLLERPIHKLQLVLEHNST